MVTTGPGDRGGGGDLEEDQPHQRAQRAVDALRAAASRPGAPAADLADRLAGAVAEALGAQGASISALFAPGMSVPVGVSDPVAARAEQLQFTAGEGPCWEAYRTGVAVVADLSDVPTSRRRWPAYARALRHETGYALVVALPVRLASGLLVALSTYEAGPGTAWWRAASQVGEALAQVLDAASPPPSAGGAVWLDSSSTARRSTVWTAEAVLIDTAPFLDHDTALDALRTYSLIEGTTVDDAAAALLEGRLTTREVLGR